MTETRRGNSKLFLALLIAAYLFSWWLWGYRGEPEVIIQVAPIREEEAVALRPEPLGAFYSTNYPEDIPAAVIAEVIQEYATYMWYSPVTLEEWLMIVKENQLEDVNPLWTAAIAAHESHLGAHSSAYERGNLWGIDKSGTDASLSDLGSLQDGARYISQLLAQYYFDEGRLTFQALEEKYASQIDPPNGAWAARVQYFYEDLTAELAQKTDPNAPVGIPVTEEDDPRFSENPYYPVVEVRTLLHRGMDIAADNSGEVWLHSTLNGKVVFAGFIENSCDFAITFTPLPDAGDCPVVALDVTGWTVVIENERWQIILGHGAEEPAVKVGDLVSRGDRLMLMGDTGYTKGRHVHYGIRYRLPSGEWRFVKP